MSILKVRLLGECAVQVGNQRITPDAPRLFALSLYMAQAQGRWIHKSELLDLLFPRTKGPRHASHSLRQLVYRLRGIGMPIRADGQRLRVDENCIRSTLTEWTELRRADRLIADVTDFRILPAYEPAISSQWTDWLETLRTRATSLVQHILEADIRALVRESDWYRVIEVCRRLALIVEASDELVAVEAEALMMLG